LSHTVIPFASALVGTIRSSGLRRDAGPFPDGPPARKYTIRGLPSRVPVELEPCPFCPHPPRPFWCSVVNRYTTWWTPGWSHGSSAAPSLEPGTYGTTSPFLAIEPLPPSLLTTSLILRTLVRYGILPSTVPSFGKKIRVALSSTVRRLGELERRAVPGLPELDDPHLDVLTGLDFFACVAGQEV
jgi:hypothetical protein